VCAIEEMIAVAYVTKRQLHIAQHSESVGVLRAQAIGHRKSINERGNAAAVAAADAVKYL
jgi:hypothetical protein